MQGELIDAICRRVYGDESGYVEQVLAVNPGLAAVSPILPLGTAVALPVLVKASEVVPVVSLWD
jgi:phage tail protein X